MTAEEKVGATAKESAAEEESVQEVEATIIDEELDGVEEIEGEAVEGEGEEQTEGTPVEVELVAAKKLASDMHDKYMRLQAEWDNFRKRTASEREQERVRASEKLVKDLLPVLDDLDRAIDHARESGEGGTLTDGVDAIRSKFLNILGKSKVEEIPALNEALDLEKHQAVGTAEDASVPEETVVQVFQKGYTMGEKVLRPAMVITSTGGPARPKEDKQLFE